jgi:hypothetical protein
MALPKLSSRSLMRNVLTRVTRGGVLVLVLRALCESSAAEVAKEWTEEVLAPLSGPRGSTMFAELSSEQTGIVTENRYADPAMWGERHREFEVGAMGTGVAIGDYDRDGRPDIFVVSKTESCRLFRNLGDWKFEDVTDRAGVADQGAAAGIWKQGATFADVNNDGWLDLYLCRFDAPNLLYINRGEGTFKEEAETRGLAVKDASVMGAFCDYDRDGWLDAFVQTNVLDTVGRPNGQRNHLFRNNGDGTFRDVTDAAGIVGDSRGHSVIWWDYDNDGWSDLYIANDFEPADQLYRNNRDGTFVNVVDRVVPHLPYSAMGSDLGDVNNDGLIDLVVAEMAATSHEKDQRAMAGSRALISQDPPEGSTAVPQYFRNALYLNTGIDRFLEVAFLAGLAATDWTWSVRWEDLDNDGWLDLHVTNGMHREAHNTDLLARMMTAQNPAERVRIERASPILAEENFGFRNRGDLRFENASAAWGLNQKGVSFGAAFGDLDGDGDLDLVFTNYQAGATVLRNDSDGGHRVIISLQGTRSNRFGVGATVRIETESGIQIRQLVLARGLVSSSEPVLHFGLGEDTRIQRLTVSWPSGQVQTLRDLAGDRRFTIIEPEAEVSPSDQVATAVIRQFTEVSASVHMDVLSRERNIDELGLNPLLPMRQNRTGPALAVGDINRDGRDDLVLGGTSIDPMRLFLAAEGGKFAPADAGKFPVDPSLNDGPLLVFDADGNGTLDLLRTKAGVALPAGSAEYQPTLLLNDGREFRPAASEALPPLPLSVGAVTAADFDRDGRLDLFIGGRVSPGLYPFSPISALLLNRGGRFEDATEAIAPGLRAVGMVTAAMWSDVDDDGFSDLLIALEWGHVKYFHNDGGRKLDDWTERAGFAAAGTGWWNSLATTDFNGDGQADYVAGNLGLNTAYRAEPERPALLYSGDFKGDGTFQLVEAHHEGDRIHPWRTRKDLGAVIPAILRRFPRNDAYARASLGEILGEEKLAAAERFAATELRSGVFLSQADGTFRFEPLPRLAQTSPIQGMVAGDFDGDGRSDIYAVQNSFAPIPSVGRFDGGVSQLLRGNGQGEFVAVPLRESGLVVPGDAKALAVLDENQDGWPDFLVTRNNSTSLAFRNNGVNGRRSLTVRLQGGPGNPTGIGSRVSMEYADGTTQSSEIQAGSGYYSQSAAGCFFGWIEDNPPRKLRVRWPSGETSEHEVPTHSASVTLSADVR